jgi:CarboxypepD_reg-like domain
LLAQVNGFVKDSRTGQPVPYINIWVENENIGTSSNENGEFSLPEVDKSKFLLLSAIGYQSKRVRIDQLSNPLYLEAAEIELSEIVIYPRKAAQEKSVGSFDAKSIYNYFSCSGYPWIVARYLPYEKEYEQTPYINAVKILTDSDVKDAKFNIRLYAVDSTGKPGKYISKENILGIAKKGKKVTTIDVSDQKIVFPTEGFFVALEYLIIEQNKHKYTTRVMPSNKIEHLISYEPSFGGIQVDENENSWIFNNKWRKQPFSHPQTGLKSLLAIELILSD